MDSQPPIDLSRFIAAIARELAARHLPFMLVGGQAVLVHGRPRLTEDIDITLGVSPEKLATVRATLVEVAGIQVPFAAA